jgi:hypothetical protein
MRRGCSLSPESREVGELCKGPRLSPPSPGMDTDSNDSLGRVLSRHLLTSTLQGAGSLPSTRQVSRRIQPDTAYQGRRPVWSGHWANTCFRVSRVDSTI